MSIGQLKVFCTSASGVFLEVPGKGDAPQSLRLHARPNRKPEPGGVAVLLSSSQRHPSSPLVSRGPRLFNTLYQPHRADCQPRRILSLVLGQSATFGFLSSFPLLLSAASTSSPHWLCQFSTCLQAARSFVFLRATFSSHCWSLPFSVRPSSPDSTCLASDSTLSDPPSRNASPNSTRLPLATTSTWLATTLLNPALTTVLA